MEHLKVILLGVLVGLIYLSILYFVGIETNGADKFIFGVLGVMQAQQLYE